jgi:hypothetical protein
MTRLGQSLPDGIYSRTPPLLRILLRIPDARRENRILRKSDTLDGALYSEYNHLHARGAEIYA